ncbi:MAG TPA: ABC transporter substrate-binding protein, partial [Chloroflexota bacterium]|nr:ABC transporter substrate-binding protein [Chloroflexota bacterium]
GLSDRVGPGKNREEYGIEWDAPNTSTLRIVPNVFESWTQNADATEYTFKLRAGMKWSDGQPVTTEDVRFYWEDMAQTPEIIPAPNTPGMRVRVGGEFVLAKLDIIDQFNFKVTYGVSNPLLPIVMAKTGAGGFNNTTWLAPAHYLKQFHPKYADVNALNARAASKNLPGWQALWGTGGNLEGPDVFWFINTEVPSINAWKTTQPAPADPHRMERNPYYWQVDPAGNQLPYIDAIEHALFDNAEVLNLWVAQGKIDMQIRHLSAGNYTFYKENEARGGYRVLRWRAASTNCYFPNITCPDPVLRQMWEDPRVREALNIAINREEINQVVFNGLGRARQASPVQGSPEFDPEHETKWTEYDPARANALLNQVVPNRGPDGIRRLPDGRPFEFVVEHTSGPGEAANDQHEFVRRYWEAIGLRATMRYVERALYEVNVRESMVDMGYWGFDRLSVIKADPGRWTAQIQDGPWAPAYGEWYEAGPFKKEEPPPGHPIRQIFALWDATQIEPDEATRNALFQQLLDIHKAAPYVVGVVGELVAPMVASNRFRNVLEGFINDDTLRDSGLINPQHFFLTS